MKEPNFLRGVIFCVLSDCFPEDYLEWVFSSEIEATDFIDAVLVELIKYCYDVTQEKHPLRYYIPYNATENHSERMMYSRTLQYIQKHRDKEYEFRKEHDGAEFEELKGKPMETMEERKEGFELTPMQFYEATAIHDKQIVKALVEKRIMDVKKVSNKKFVEIMDEYEQWIDSMEAASKNSDEDMVMYSLAFFTIEWKYATELVYGMADHMIKEKIENPELQAYAILCADMTIESVLGFHMKTHSRMVKERQRMIASLVVPEGEITLEVNNDAHRYAEMLVMKAGYACSMKLSWLNEAVRMLKESLPEAEYKEKMNEYLSFEIDSPTRLRKTREILMNVWYYPSEELDPIRQEAIAVLNEYPECSEPIQYLMLCLTYPVFKDVCKIMGKLFEFQDDITNPALKQQLYDAWGERGTLETTTRRITLTLKEMDVLRNETKTRYLLHKLPITNDKVLDFVIAQGMRLDGSSYYSYTELEHLNILFPFQYEVKKELLMQSDKYTMSGFGGEVAFSLKG